MKLLIVLLSLIFSINAWAFPWYFGDDAAVLIPSKITKQGSTGELDLSGNAVEASPLFNVGNLRMSGNSLIMTLPYLETLIV
jgi:hypothetical protein